MSGTRRPLSLGRQQLKCSVTWAQEAVHLPTVRLLEQIPDSTPPHVAVRVIASQAAVPLVYVPIEAVASKWYGESERLLSDVFRQSDRLTGCIVFLDELDSLASSRCAALTWGAAAQKARPPVHSSCTLVVRSCKSTCSSCPAADGCGVGKDCMANPSSCIASRHAECEGQAMGARLCLSTLPVHADQA